jgi:adenine-specific DNA-methyltransferase
MIDRAPYETHRSFIQQECDSGKTQSERNRLGQFATPSALAMEMLAVAKSLLFPVQQVRFFDPAFGTGAFYSALLDSVDPQRISAAMGVEIDRHYGLPARKLWRGHDVTLRFADFTKVIPPKSDSRFNLVVCNPPYVRHHHLNGSEKIRLQELAGQVAGTGVSGLAGLYCYFLLLAHSWMSEEGLGIWLVPSEFMDVNYGVALKQYLLSKVTLLRLHRFSPEDVQFGDALISSCVVCFRKTIPRPEHSIEFTFGGSLVAPHESRFVQSTTLSAKTKWNGDNIRTPRLPSNQVTLSDFFTVKRGLATGDNKFFILTREQIRKHKLPMKFFRPILPSPRHLTVDEISAHRNGNPQLRQPLFILDCRLREDELRGAHPTLWRYLKSAERSVGQRYLCRSRSPWYSQENRPASFLLCTYMGRHRKADDRPFRFILNHSRATAANVYLLLYPKQDLVQSLRSKPELGRKIWVWLNALSPAIVSREGRVYGGGLHKIEPKELGNLPAQGIARILNRPIERTGVQLQLIPANEMSRVATHY